MTFVLFRLKKSGFMKKTVGTGLFIIFVGCVSVADAIVWTFLIKAKHTGPGFFPDIQAKF